MIESVKSDRSRGEKLVSRLLQRLMARATGAVGVAFRRWDAIAAHRTSEAVRRRGEIEQSTRTLHAAWRASQKRALAAAFSRIKLIAKHQSAANDATVAARRAALTQVRGRLDAALFLFLFLFISLSLSLSLSFSFSRMIRVLEPRRRLSGETAVLRHH